MTKLLGSMLRSDGYKALRIGREPGEVVYLRKYVPHFVIENFSELIQVTEAEEWVVVCFPAINAFQFRQGKVWRELFVVHRAYGSGVRDCARLGMEAWRFVGKEAVNAFVRKLPNGVENGIEVDGVHLFEAEWMCTDAVAVGL